MLRRVRPVLAALLLVACTWALVAQWNDVRPYLASIGPGAFAGSLAVSMVGAWFGFAGWRVLLNDVGGQLGVRDGVAVHFAGQLGKYVPGAVWPVVTQATLGRDRGVPRSVTVAAFVLQMLVTLAAGIAVAAVLLPFGDPTALADRWWLLALLPVVVASLHPAVLGRLARLAARVLRRPEAPPTPSAGAIAWAGVLTVISFALFGVHLLLLVQPMHPDGDRVLVQVTGAFALAWAVGFVVIITPAGLGVREVAMTVALSAVLPSGAATAVALSSRLVLTATDLVWGAVSMALLANDRRRRAQPSVLGRIRDT